MNKRFFSWVLATVAFTATAASQAAVHRVMPGDDIQAAIDGALPGDTILVEPGEYTTSNSDFGLRISTDNLRLIGKVKRNRGEAGKVIILPSGDQFTGIYAAPENCGPEILGSCVIDGEEQILRDFYIRGFTVKDFSKNGIQTRFVDGFKIIRNEVGDVDLNGIYPTISANGLVQNNVAYGTKDTAMWVAASENVRVIGNDLSLSPIGLEVNVSLNVEVMHNDIHNNTVGVALFHPNSAGNLPREEMGNWVVRNNNVYDNNLENPAPGDSFQGALPPGVGILILGTSGNVVEKNTVENNEFVGIGVLGWCSATAIIPRFNCIEKPPVIPALPDPDAVFYDPSVSDNQISQNKLNGNGLNPPTDEPFDEIAYLAADLTYFSFWPDPPFEFPVGPETSSGNCFEKNKKEGEFTTSAYDAPPDLGGTDGDLPTDGC